MIYLRFSGTDTTLSHLFLPDLRPYTNRHDLRKKSLAAKKQHLRHQQKKRISGRKTLQKRCKPPRNIHPDTLLIPFPYMKTGQAGQPDNRTTRQPDNPTNRQTDRRRYTCGKPSDKYKGKNRYRKKKGKRKGKRSGDTFRTKENAALAKPRMGFSIGFSSFAKLTIKSPQFHCSHSPVRFQAFFPANFTQKSRYARPGFPPAVLHGLIPVFCGQPREQSAFFLPDQRIAPDAHP